MFLFRATLALSIAMSVSQGQTQTQTLNVAYSFQLQDNDVYAFECELKEAQQRGYKPIGQDGLVFNATRDGAVPLKRFYKSNATSADTLLVASQEGIQYAKDNGYTFVRIDGYVYTSNTTACNASATQGCPALEQWYSQERDDNFLVGSAINRANAISAGYKLVRIEGYQAEQPVPPPPGWHPWPSEPPSSCPFAQSTDITSVHFNFGQNANYGNADTWYPSWGSDDVLYTPWTDGCVTDMETKQQICSSSVGKGSNGSSTTGYALVTGDAPFNLTVSHVATFESYTLPYQGRYPCGTLYHNDTWFYGTYTLDNPQIPPNPPPNCGNWCVQGPFVGFRISKDQGKTWFEPRLHMKNFTDNVFGETAANNSKVKFGAPHVVDFGKELQHSPDGKMYIVGHGAVRPEAHQSWMQGDQVYMARALPDPDTINDIGSWEFFAGHAPSSGQPVWVRGEVSKAQPLFTWNNHTGVVTMTYLPSLNKYIMCVSTPTFSPYTTKQFDTYFLEADQATGPFRIITYMREFGPESYFVHLPSKFQDTKISTLPDGTKVAHGFLSYSANFAFHSATPNPPGSGYHWSLQEMRFVLS